MQSEITKPKYIKTTEDHYGVTHVGYYGLPDGREMDVFYQANPNLDLGHSNYMGLFAVPKGNPALPETEADWYVTNAKGIAEATFPAIQLEDGRFIVSRYRHDFVRDEATDAFIDGGLEYTRSNRPVNAYMKVIDGKEVLYANAPTHGDSIRTD